MMTVRMRRTKQKRTTLSWLRVAARLVVALIFIDGIAGCQFSFQRLEFRRAVRACSRGQFDEGLALIDKIIKRDPDSVMAVSAARYGARVAALDAKNYQRAIQFYRNLVLFSPDREERMKSQRQIAEIYFGNLANYEQAIVEYNKLLRLSDKDEEKYEYRFNIAKAYYQLNNFYQSSVEIDELLSRDIPEGRRFDVLLFKANLLLTEKKLDKAVDSYLDLLKKYPERAKTENVALNLSVCYEEKSEISKAIQVLETLKKDYPTPDFIDLKIQRLHDRRANLPGAEGLKK